MRPEYPKDGFEPFRELEWFADFFAMHATEAVAHVYFQKLVALRQAAQKQLGQSFDDPEISNVIPLFGNRAD